jgi:hypothetical protein
METRLSFFNSGTADNAEGADMAKSPEVEHLLKAVDAVKSGLMPEKKKEPTPEPDVEVESDANERNDTRE